MLIPVCWYRCVGIGVLVPVRRYRCAGTSVLILVCWYRCAGTSVAVLVWQIARKTSVPFGVQARDMEFESWKEDRIQKPTYTHREEYYSTN
jgi:hypothetical protein